MSGQVIEIEGNDMSKANVAVRTETAFPVPSGAASIIHIIERASRDPSVDIAKLRELIALRNEINAQEAKEAYNEAMRSAQADMRPIATDATNPQTKSKYASYTALDRALRPIYSKHGFSITFDTGDGAPPDYVRVLCDVSAHGHTRQHHIDMPADGKGAKGGDVMTRTHATGSAVSYGRRYLLQMIFNIAVGDDDGNAAGGDVKLITKEQAEQIKGLSANLDSDAMQGFLKYLGAESIETIPTGKYANAIYALGLKKGKEKKEEKGEAK